MVETKTWHIGRAFNGPSLLDENCPCPNAACGLVIANSIDNSCDQHGFMAGKTMRSGHPEENCELMQAQWAELKKS